MQAARQDDGGSDVETDPDGGDGGDGGERDGGARDGGGRFETDRTPPPPPRAPGGTVRRGVPSGDGPGDRALRRRRADRLRAALVARRERLRADAHANRVYRTVVGLLGALVVVVGLLLVPLPGPGWLVVFLGLAVLGSEFHWARRLQRFGRRQLHRWTAWVVRRSWRTRIALGSTTALAVAGAAYGYLAWQGVPAWSPEVVTAQLTRVPGL